MIKVTNEFVAKSGLSKAEAYSAFGLHQLGIINKRIEKWLAEQSFAKDAPPATFQEMQISGNSDYTDYHREKYSDRVQWDLRFAPSTIKVPRTLTEALLHIKRLPNVEVLNSEPSFLKTDEYIHIGVQNGEQGWVKNGAFPTNVRLKTRVVDDDNALGGIKSMIEPAYTDIKREAEAGFRVAFEWAKFRTMALACSVYLADRLKEELKEFDGKIHFEARDRMRDRRETIYPFMLELFPDTRIRSGATALRPYYKPGYLEAELAREIQKKAYLRFGSSKPGEEWVIYRMSGKPIEIISTHGKGAYDARISFQITTQSARSLENEEVVRASIEAQLGKYFDVSVKTLSDMDVTFKLNDAHKIVENIKEGKDDTYLHIQARALLDALRETTSLIRSWDGDKMPMLGEGFKAMVAATKQSHFSRLSGSLADVVRHYGIKD